MVEGLLPIRDVNRLMDWDLPDEEATTVAGLVIHEAQTIPNPGQTFNFHGFRFEVLRRHRNRITRLRVVPLSEPHGKIEPEGKTADKSNTKTGSSWSLSRFLFRIGGRQRGYSKGMNFTRQFIGQHVIHHAVTLQPRLASEGAGHHTHGEVAFTGAWRAGMAGVLMGLIDDL